MRTHIPLILLSVFVLFVGSGFVIANIALNRDAKRKTATAKRLGKLDRLMGRGRDDV